MWKIKYISDARTDLKKIDGSIIKQILAGINKVGKNPLAIQAGGYGKPLGKHPGLNLKGLYKIKFRKIGIRVVYKLDMDNSEMVIILISPRENGTCYKEAAKRKDFQNA